MREWKPWRIKTVEVFDSSRFPEVKGETGDRERRKTIRQFLPRRTLRIAKKGITTFYYKDIKRMKAGRAASYCEEQERAETGDKERQKTVRQFFTAKNAKELKKGITAFYGKGTKNRKDGERRKESKSI